MTLISRHKYDLDIRKIKKKNLICVNMCQYHRQTGKWNLTKSITLLLFKMKKLIIFILFYNLDRYCKKTQYIF